MGMIGVVALAAGAAAWAFSHSGLAGVIVAAVVALFMGARWRFGTKKVSNGLPEATVEVTASRIRCRDLVEGDADWAKLTPFRWVIGGDTSEGRAYMRSDEDPDLPGDQVGEFVVEAALLAQASEANPYGYYSNPEIQFDLPPLVIGSTTRLRADMMVEWLNDLQRRAKSSQLSSNESVTIPVWLNLSQLSTAKAPILESPAVERSKR